MFAWTDSNHFDQTVGRDSINDSESTYAIASQTGKFFSQRFSACRRLDNSL
jgi:hypothetical protein